MQEISGDTPARVNLLFGSPWEALQRFFPHFQTGGSVPKEAHQQRENRSQQNAQQGWREQTFPGETQASEGREIRIQCVECGASLWLKVLETESGLCPICQTEYQSVQALKEPRVFLVIPTASRSRGAAHGERKRTLDLSPDVLHALSVLGLTEEASSEDVRRAFRRKIKQHHPDKVTAGTARETLRVAAELKTAELISAYRVVERAYSEG